jgi:hypothetical protein
MVQKNNAWDDEFERTLRDATAEQIGRAIGSNENVLNGIQEEIDFERQLPKGYTGPSLPQRVAKRVAEVLTAP